MKAAAEVYLILGITKAERPFRPSDWAERLCGALASYDNKGCWVYSEHAQPIIHQGKIGVRVEKVLQTIDPAAFQFIMQFAYNYQLKILPEPEVIRLDESTVMQEVSLPARKLTFAI